MDRTVMGSGPGSFWRPWICRPALALAVRPSSWCWHRSHRAGSCSKDHHVATYSSMDAPSTVPAPVSVANPGELATSSELGHFRTSARFYLSLDELFHR